MADLLHPEAQPFLDSIVLVQTTPCLAEPGKIIVVGRPSSALNAVLPYLATLPNVIAYNPNAPALTFRRQPGFLTLYADRVYITQVTDHEEGQQLLAALTDAINATWTHRHAITAVTTRRAAPRPLDVWSLLPQTNCGECGEPTCMAFAFALIQQRRALAECAVLADDPALAGQRAAIEAML